MIIMVREEDRGPLENRNQPQMLDNVKNNFRTDLLCSSQRQSFLSSIGFDPLDDVFPLANVKEEVVELIARLDSTLTFMDESIDIYPLLHDALTRDYNTLLNNIEAKFIDICTYLQDVYSNWKVGSAGVNCGNPSRSDLLFDLKRRYYEAFDNANRLIKEAVIQVAPGASNIMKFIAALGGAIVARFFRVIGIVGKLGEKLNIPSQLVEEVIKRATQFIAGSVDPFKELIENAALGLSGADDDYTAAVNAVLNDPEFAAYLNDAICASRQSDSAIIYNAFHENLVVAYNSWKNGEETAGAKIAAACDRDVYNMVLHLGNDITEINCNLPDSFSDMVFEYNAFCPLYGYPPIE